MAQQQQDTVDPPFIYRREIKFYETDMVGIVHFSNFFRLMEEAEIAFWKSRGISLFEAWEGKILSFPRVSAKCDFKSSAKFDDMLDIVVQVLRVGRSSISFGFEMRIGDRLLATGEVTACCCELSHGNAPKPIGIPPHILEKLRGHSGERG